MLENSFTVVIGLIIGGLILAKYFMKKSISSIPIFAFPPDGRENFNTIRKDRLDPLFTSFVKIEISDRTKKISKPGTGHWFNLQR